MAEIAIHWLYGNWIELFGTISGLLYIFFSIKQHILLWPIGAITSIAFIGVFFSSRLYAEMFLQVYYLLISIYGWYHWVFINKFKTRDKLLPVTNTKRQTWLKIAFFTIIINIIIYYILKHYTDSQVPFWDSIITSSSIIATWMLAQKLVEQWILWIIIDFGSIALFLYKGLYLTSLLSLVYAILAFIGYYQWKKEIISNSE
jgi:nicotinamide mononucleotide transporter